MIKPGDNKPISLSKRDLQKNYDNYLIKPCKRNRMLKRYVTKQKEDYRIYKDFTLKNRVFELQTQNE